MPQNVSCKSTNIIYGDICNQCTTENIYVGQASQSLHLRNNGHRRCFNADDFKQSALATHAVLDHGLESGLNLSDFNCAILKKTHFLNLDREEFKFCEKLRVKVLGLNRCKIVKE